MLKFIGLMLLLVTVLVELVKRVRVEVRSIVRKSVVVGSGDTARLISSEMRGVSRRIWYQSVQKQR